MPLTLDSGPAAAVPSRCALGIGRHRRDARLDTTVLDIKAYVEYGKKSSLDSVVETTTVRATREREE
jgi:hypothetical protein